MAFKVSFSNGAIFQLIAISSVLFAFKRHSSRNEAPTSSRQDILDMPQYGTVPHEYKK
jgi:hypothetical protein